MIVTRILISDTPTALLPICKATGFMRADLWRRYGGLKTVGKSAFDISKELNAYKHYHGLGIDSQIRGATALDTINDILAYKAAAKAAVRKDIAARTSDPEERKRLFTLLKADKWFEDSYLHRRMRKHFRHGRSSVENQFIVHAKRHVEAVVDGKLQITIKIAKKYGSDITLTTTSSGKNVNLKGRNLRIIVKEDRTEIHYAFEKPPGRPCGNRDIGVDKGYTEAFTDSDGEHHGAAYGQVMRTYSDKIAATGKQRNKLHALEKKHRAAGRTAKADRIKICNLGRKKLHRRREKTQQHLRAVAYQAAHTVVDKAATVVSEDLTSPISSKGNRGKAYNRRMSAWAKGVLAQALTQVCSQRGAKHVLVNAAYTSQMDSETGLLLGSRRGDKFYCASGDVLQADANAAKNVLSRLYDTEITRFMPFSEVRRVLLARSPAQPSVKRLELAANVVQPSAEKLL